MKTILQILVEKLREVAKMESTPPQFISMKTLRCFILFIIVLLSFQLVARADCSGGDLTCVDGELLANLKGATGINIIAKKVVLNAAGVSVEFTIPNGGTLDFGTLKEYTFQGSNGQIYKIYLPANSEYMYFLIKPNPGGSMAERMNITFEYVNDGNHPNAPSGHGLGHKASVYFRKKYQTVSPFSPCFEEGMSSSSPEVPLFSDPPHIYGQNVRFSLQSINGLNMQLNDFCHTVKMYLIINDLNPAYQWVSLLSPSEVFSNADKAGDYTGILTITGTLP